MTGTDVILSFRSPVDATTGSLALLQAEGLLLCPAAVKHRIPGVSNSLIQFLPLKTLKWFLTQGLCIFNEL